jgi:hypothetical protein
VQLTFCFATTQSHKGISAATNNSQSGWCFSALLGILGYTGFYHLHRPINAIINPIPAPTAITSDCGIIRANHCLSPHSDRTKKMIL